MKLLVITHPDKIEAEAERITALFREGLELLHLRKPDWDFGKFETLLKQLPPQYYRKVVIHSHFKLIEKYNLRGIHLKGEYLSGTHKQELKEIFKLATKRNITISASMHSFREIEENKWMFDYVFLSPVFDSISKKGYQSGFDPEVLGKFMKEYKGAIPIIALGGIDENNIEKIVSIGFSGAALLGSVWSEGVSVDKFRNIRSKANA